MNNRQGKLPKIAFVFADLSFGGSNLQTVKIIQYSGAVENCLVITLVDTANDAAIEDKFLEIGIKPIHLKFEKRKLFSELFRLKKVVIENHCQLVNSNGLRSDMICHYAFQGTKVKHVITLHNYLREDAFLRMNRFKASVAILLQTQILHKSKYVVACSKTLRKQTESDIKGLHVTAIQNGVNLDDYPLLNKIELRKQYGFPENALIFISTGSMTLRKRIPETINAFMCAGLTTAKLLIVGSGPYLDEYQNRYAYNDQVIFLGRRNDIKEFIEYSRCVRVF